MALRQCTDVFVKRLSDSQPMTIYWYTGLLTPELVDAIRQASMEEARRIVDDEETANRITLKTKAPVRWRQVFSLLFKRIL